MRTGAVEAIERESLAPEDRVQYNEQSKQAQVQLSSGTEFRRT